MPSTLTWLDYSERDRRRALDVIDLFRETGTLDELGIGAIRDSFSDLLFPGTSTVQTRACYFLILPWTFLRLERLGVPSASAAERARAEELKLNAVLCQGSDTEGVFGNTSGRALKRLPSAAYSGGLGKWGIRLFPAHLDAYFHSLDDFYRRLARAKQSEMDPEGRRGLPANWHPHLPGPPPGFPYEASVVLRREDAEYLCDRIESLHSGTLLAELAARAEPLDLGAGKPWDLAARSGLPPKIRQQLHHARLFSLVQHGAALLYNLMLAEALGDAKTDRIARFQSQLEEWAREIEAGETEVTAWDLTELWEVAGAAGYRIRFTTRTFVQQWLDIVRREGPAGVVREGSPARPLIRDRELRLKGRRARLHNRRQLELWGGSSGTDPLDFRWRNTKRILRDIFDGLARGAGGEG